MRGRLAAVQLALSVKRREGEKMETSQAMPMAGAASSTRLVQDVALGHVRLAFIDNLRILLVILVILFHLATTYGGAGYWHYHEEGADAATVAVLTLFVAVNQAFFMGFYFLIAAYFVPRTLERKGSTRFARERLLRLGIPLLVQVLIIMPLLSYMLGVTVWGFAGSFWTYIALYWNQYRSLDTGPLWFVEALLIFSLVYALWWAVVKPAPRQGSEARATTPRNLVIATFGVALGLATFVVRIWLPVGWFFAPLNFQLAHFPQYISLFVLGAVAYRRGWLGTLVKDAARGRRWGRVAFCLIGFAPVLLVAGGALQGDTRPFLGGMHWQALAYGLWEQLLCLAMVLSLLAWFHKRYDRQHKLAKEMSASAYAVYILHTPVLVGVAVGLRHMELYPLLKFALASLICVPLCFLVGGMARRLPGARRIL